jgi:hypothetical protein
MKFIILFLLYIITISTDYFTGELRNIELFGIIDKKLIIAYNGSEKPKAVYLRYGEELEYDKNLSDEDKNLKYGYRKSNYAEFSVPNSEEIIIVSNAKIISEFNDDPERFLQEYTIDKGGLEGRLLFFKIKNNGSLEKLDQQYIHYYIEKIYKTEL